MEPEHLDTLYHLLSTLDMATVRGAIDQGGLTAEELLEAVNALAEETGNDPLFTPEELGC